MIHSVTERIDEGRTLLTVGEVSRLLHVHSNTLRRWSDRGILRACRIGPRGDRRYRAGDVAIFLLEENKGFQMNLDLIIRDGNRKFEGLEDKLASGPRSR